jgi:DNA-binding MarR family transcriptional regulator
MKIFDNENKTTVEGWNLVAMAWTFLSAIFDDTASVTAAHELHQKSLVLLALLDKVDTPQGLSNRLRFPASTVSHMLSELERKEFITRTLDASDKRRFRLERTPAGQQALDAGIAAINSAVAARMEGLSLDEQELLSRALPLLTRLVESHELSDDKKPTQN